MGLHDMEAHFLFPLLVSNNSKESVMNGDTLTNILALGLLFALALLGIAYCARAYLYVHSGEYEADLRLNAIFQALNNAKNRR